ncbi:3-(3-hydroxy-phenyl)propionate/3-hydroxycinnamic acid hydroxylase-like [Ptychodera flava]|uniref:3-(3-hydroxy-phenyl)propionate/3-hydroxycinnamic acid hydroxylase-like n=1 Tax=Ptychodera flava TaxID=63121 RepID=UPI00396A6559
MNNIAKFDVIISGLGPVGAVTANLLAQYGLTVAVFERDFEIYNLGPRAIAIDAEAMIVFGMMGLDDWLDSHVVKPCIGVRTGVPPNGVTLLSVKPERHSLYGHQRIAFFNQPCLEKTLRDNLEQYSNVKVYLGHERIVERIFE